MVALKLRNSPYTANGKQVERFLANVPIVPNSVHFGVFQKGQRLTEAVVLFDSEAVATDAKN